MTSHQPQASRVRWMILAVLFAVTTINYADRATIAIAGPELKKLLGLSASQMGWVFSAFAWSYVLAQLPGGWLLDRFGSKITYFFSIFLWSLFTMFMGGVGFFTGAAAVTALFVLRLLIGAAESPSFPGNSRIASSWFPVSERGTAAAIFNSAQYFATVLFAPIMGWLVHSFGWESVFFVMGGLGIIMAFVWLKTVYGPKDHPRVNAAELAYIEAGGALVDLESKDKAAATTKLDTWSCIKQLLGNRMLLGVYIGQYCINTLTYFFLTWFPVYLVQERHMTILKAGFVAALPAVAGFLGGVLGGVISDRLIKSGKSQSAARKIPIVGGMLLSTSMIVCNYVEADWLVITVMSLAFFGKGIGALGWAVVADTSPKEAGGMSGALFNTFGNTAGITTPIVIGYILEKTGSFSGALVFVGANALVTILCYLLMVGEIKRFEFKTPVMRNIEPLPDAA
ncbi:MFS transporter, ACS family, glucarate transporter [Duganella sp. CF402]|uniref:MFS transporter n=1 Tax=unclassified Duganella TaxID=2636909 RepID=UPI0008B93B46|nr:MULTISPECIES: MFS transporter [unclassified Duganella]RZT10847.1 ACS family glucarate transporter-like MFS transporter [Duganella sp. BK701]SEK93852.1 MFS transporter, ACS family, glucarate transporter [Duganella sp. CF402]